MTSSSDLKRTTDREPEPSVRWWLPALALLLCVAGLGIATYMTVIHYTGEMPMCSANSLVDCESVTTSPESVVFGIPVALLGLLYFAYMIVVCLPPMWNPGNRLLRMARLGGLAAGILFVVYLVSAELLLIGKICLWCTGVHVIVIALAAVLIAGTMGWGTTLSTDPAASTDAAAAHKR